jgi:hypothetical protein
MINRAMNCQTDVTDQVHTNRAMNCHMLLHGKHNERVLIVLLILFIAANGNLLQEKVRTRFIVSASRNGQTARKIYLPTMWW